MSGGWVLVRDFARAGTDPTEEEAKIAYEVQQVALEFAAGTMPLAVALQATTFRHRFIAQRFTERGTPRWMALMRLLDAAVRAQGCWLTPQGIITRTELHEGHARIVHEDGKEVCLFAAGYDAGGAPWYRKPEQRNPFRGQFRDVPMKPEDADDQAGVSWRDRLEPSER